jgi:hypothetical protein
MMRVEGHYEKEAVSQVGWEAKVELVTRCFLVVVDVLHEGGRQLR